MLLQLHILLPEIEDAQFDDVFDLVYEGGFFVPDDGRVTDERFFSTPHGVETEVQTCLFEEGPDNLEGAEKIHQELIEMFPNSTVFKYRVEETFREYRSVADPDERIILYVGNTGLEEPRIRWRHECEPYEVSPRVANNRVFHAGSGRVFALGGDSGELLWEHPFDQVVSRPEAREDFVVAAGAFCIRGLDATTGEQVWHVDFDQTEIEMIESRAEVGPEYVYLGTRSGDVLKISKTSGEWSVLHGFSESIHELKYTDVGVLVRTNGDGSHMVGADGTLRVTFENSVSFGPVQDGVLYGTRYIEGSPDITAITLDDGTEQWAVEAKTTGALSVTDRTILAPTKDGVIRLDCDDGGVLWQNNIRVDSAVPLSATVAGGLSNDRNLQLFRIENGELITRFSFGGPTQSPVVTDNGAVFVTGPELVCLEAFPESRDD